MGERGIFLALIVVLLVLLVAAVANRSGGGTWPGHAGHASFGGPPEHQALGLHQDVSRAPEACAPVMGEAFLRVASLLSSTAKFVGEVGRAHFLAEAPPAPDSPLAQEPGGGTAMGQLLAPVDELHAALDAVLTDVQWGESTHAWVPRLAAAGHMERVRAARGALSAHLRGKSPAGAAPEYYAEALADLARGARSALLLWDALLARRPAAAPLKSIRTLTPPAGQKEGISNRPWIHSSSRRRGLPYFRPPDHPLASWIARGYARPEPPTELDQEQQLYQAYNPWWIWGAWPGGRWHHDQLRQFVFPGFASRGAGDVGD